MEDKKYKIADLQEKSEDEENKNLVTAAKISFPDELKDKVLPGADVTVQITIDR